MSAAFALLSDAVLMRYGGKFKFREKLSGRLADVLIHLYLCSAVLKRLWWLFKEHDIEIPFPQRDLNLRGNKQFERLVDALAERKADENGPAREDTEAAKPPKD